ncbi:hypothetical protein [Cellulophaga baltica]|uniref:hypothetical protein n=1 Tax=Cellulophaga baltica TaxID=76594 RepID=UPI0024954649|nr:hypothetical protein [Cellulophaga baltica]
MKTTNNKWLSSKEAINYAKLRSCDLMHYRIQGKLKFEKRGNAYFYTKDSIDDIKK